MTESTVHNNCHSNTKIKIINSFQHFNFRYSSGACILCASNNSVHMIWFMIPPPTNNHSFGCSTSLVVIKANFKLFGRVWILSKMGWFWARRPFGLIIHSLDHDEYCSLLSNRDGEDFFFASLSSNFVSHSCIFPVFPSVEERF